VRTFNVPNEAVDSTASGDFKILCRNSDGADWIASTATTRYANMKKYCNMTLGAEMDFLVLNDQIDLSFYGMVREPVRIIELKNDKDKNHIQIKGVFLNTPETYYARDTDAPNAETLFDVLPLGDGGLLLKWTKNTSSDFVGNKIYFTASRGEWYSEFCNKGQSPIDSKSESSTDDGFYYKILYEFGNGTTYSFKITAYDTSLNESPESNIIDVASYSSNTENMYRCTGELFIDGISLDELNSEGGTVPTGFLKFGDGTYADDFYTYCSLYDSYLFKSDDISGYFTGVTYFGVGDAGDLYFSWRSWDPTDGYGSWSTPTTAVGVQYTSLGTTTKYAQFRFLFASSLWGDGDLCYILEVI
jgi:hypothetical protein